MIRQILALVAVMLLAVAPVAVAQDFCKGNFDYDDNVDGSDASVFKTHFGRNSYENPCPPDGPAPFPKTGQTTSYATGDDGDLERGIDKPIQKDRFTDNGDGTVQDNLTGLTWLKDANCFGGRTWNEALSDANGLASGSCGLTDSSSTGDWRLPNLFESQSLHDMEYYFPCLSNSAGTGQWSEGDPFTNVQINWYWTSTTNAHYTDNAFNVNMGHGETGWGEKSFILLVWPVRGGH